MAKSNSLPDHVLRIQNYDDLERYARAFAENYLNLLFLCGDPGLGKSQCVRRTVGNAVCWIGGNATAFGIYMQAYENRNRRIVLDDVDGLYRDRNGLRLLKALCQTDRTKSLSWQSDAHTLERRDIPRQFTTTSRVAIIANQWQSLNADVAALEDRGHFLLFAPTAIEVHRQAAVWFWDQEIFDFVASFLHLMARPSLRTYVLASELKDAGLDWRREVLGRCVAGIDLEVAILRANPNFQSEEERVHAFVAAGKGCRATYFNHARTLSPAVETPNILLTHSAQPVVVNATSEPTDLGGAPVPTT